jgi:hypothetical protein
MSILDRLEEHEGKQYLRFDADLISPQAFLYQIEMHSYAKSLANSPEFMKSIKDIDEPKLRHLYILKSLDKLGRKSFFFEHAAEVGRMLEEFFNTSVDTGWKRLREAYLENQALLPPALKGENLPTDYQFIRDFDKKGKLNEVILELKSLDFSIPIQHK